MGSENDVIIKVRELCFGYRSYEENEQPVKVLDNISLDIKRGEFIAVLGRNGSGKSTFAKHLNAILTPVSGKVIADGFDTSDAENLLNIRKRIGMVFQNPDNQIVSSVVEEDVAFALENMGVSPDEIRKRVDDALKAVNMYEYRLHSTSQLSGGQKQRVAIAGIFAMRPDCIVMDEPTAMLDPSGRREIMAAIKKLNRDFGITIVLITHHMNEAVQADRVVVIDKGRIHLDDVPQKVFSQVRLLKSLGLDVPQSTELIYRLKQSGFDLPEGIITESECVKAILSLFER